MIKKITGMFDKINKFKEEAESPLDLSSLAGFREVEFCFLFRRAPLLGGVEDNIYLKRHVLTIDLQGLSTLFLCEEMTVTQAINIVSDYSHAVFERNSNKQILISLREQGFEVLLAALTSMQGKPGLEAITNYIRKYPDVAKLNVAFVINQKSRDLNSLALVSFFIINAELNHDGIEQLKSMCFE